MIKNCLFLPVFLLCFAAHSQHVYAPLDADYYHLIDREEVRQGQWFNDIHSSFKPYLRKDIVKSIDSTWQTSNKNYLLTDNCNCIDDVSKSKSSLWKKFYQNKADFYRVDEANFTLQANPVLYLAMGKDNQAQSSPFINTRGVEIAGSIDNKIGFYSYIGENQALFPQYVSDRIATTGAVPNEAFWKKFGDNGGVDFIAARGYISLQASKSIGIQFGYDKNFIGNGYRSVLLSDFSAPSTFLKIQTKVWRIQYTNLFTELIADAPFSSFGSNGVQQFPKKFMTMHHLSFNISDKLNVGLFESIIFHRGDSLSSAFEWNYLNPIIFYRSVEQYNGSPDNALFGMDFKWNISKGLQLYGQGMLDELVLGELKAGNGWWGNKFAVQLGSKYINVLGIDNLDLQLEYNLARPFTYSHEDYYTNYAHYRQPLAHPMGASFKEAIAIVRYRPNSKLFLSTKVIAATYGTDPVGENYGSNVLKSYNTRVNDSGNTIGQGNNNRLMYIDAKASYMLKHNLFIDLQHIYRNNRSDDENRHFTTNFSSLAIRLNIAARDYSF